MKNKNHYTEDPTTILTGDIIEPSPAKRSLSLLLSSRSGSLMLQDAMLQAGNDHCRALLAQTAMEHAGALAVITGRLNSIAPQGGRYYQAVLEAYAEKPWKGQEVVAMTELIILLALSICLALLAAFLLICYSDYRRMKRENRQLTYVLEDHFDLQSDSLDAYRAMVREACREGGFWEDTNGARNEDAEDY